jgi:hypothetical protein
MGRIIRRTVTITITESWTIVWTNDVQADDKPQPQTTTIVQDQPNTQEKQDETLQATVIVADPGKSRASDLMTPLPIPDGVNTKPAVGKQRKRARGRLAKGEQGSK